MENTNKAERYLGMARRAGRLEIGEIDTGEAVRRRKARLVLVAADASDNAKRHAEAYVSARLIPLIQLHQTKEELQELLGKAGCSMMAVTDLGLAAAFAEELAEDEPEACGKAAALLADLKAEEERREKASEAELSKKKFVWGRKRV